MEILPEAAVRMQIKSESLESPENGIIETVNSGSECSSAVSYDEAFQNVINEIEKHISTNKNKGIKKMVSNIKPKRHLVYQCPFCDESFKKYNLSIHLENHIEISKTSPRMCMICFTTFESHYQLLPHLVSHATFQYKCQCNFTECDKNVFHKHLLQVHCRPEEKILKTTKKDLEQKSKKKGDGVIRKNIACTSSETPLGRTRSLIDEDEDVNLQTSPITIDDIWVFCSFKCPVCNQQMRNKISLFQHLLNHFNTSYACTRCPKWFERRMELREHLKLHLGEQTYQCDHCDKFVDNEQQFLVHCAEHTLDKISKCAASGAKTEEMKPLIPELNLTKKLIDGKRRYFCNLCDKSYSAKRDCSVHLGEHTGAPPTYVCSDCGKVSFTRAVHYQHKKTHKNKDGSMCDLCGQRYSNVNSMLAHKKAMHEKRQDYTCDVCGKGFPFKQRLKKHIVIHTGDRPYQCEFCGKKFSQQGNQVQHRRLHTGEKPYECEYCHKRFALRASYTQHIRIHTGYKVSELKRIHQERFNL